MDAIDYRFWIAVAAMASITWLTRALPFLGGQRRLDALSRPDTPLSMLGPSLLAAICAAVILPDLLHAAENALLPPYLSGLLLTAVFAVLIENAGIAVLMSIFSYGLLLVMWPLH
ncbi:AzlD domain-containing protein [Oxalobacteraceae bacterium CAVE-383]|nr:AzlD domain-containing protein [Oxalobacteraceae bacterium CAVE-383]